MVFESKRLDKRAVAAGATALVVVMFLFKAIQVGWPYYDAPGSSLAAVLAQYRHWTAHDLRLALLASTAVAVLLIAYRRRRGVAAVALVLALGWMLSTEIAATVGIDRLATTFRDNLPKPLDWVDQANRRTPTVYLGQAIKDGNGENLTEFWNRSITKVESLTELPRPGTDAEREPAPSRRPALEPRRRPVRPRGLRRQPQRARGREERGDDALPGRRALASRGRRAAGLPRHLVPRLVQLHLLRARAERRPQGLPGPARLQRLRTGGTGHGGDRHRPDRPAAPDSALRRHPARRAPPRPKRRRA